MISVCYSTQFGAGRRHPIAVQSLPPPADRISVNFMRFRRPDRRLFLKCSSSLKALVLRRRHQYLCASSSSRDSESEAELDIPITATGLKQCGVALAMMTALFLIPNRDFSSRPLLSCLPPVPLLFSSSSSSEAKAEETKQVHSAILLVRLASCTHRVFAAYNSVEETAFIGCQVCWFLAEQARLALGAVPNNYTVLQLQVALLGPAKSVLCKIFSDISADSTCSTHVFRVLTEIRRDLLNHQHYWISASSFWKVETSAAKASEHMDQLIEEEKVKWNEVKSHRDTAKSDPNDYKVLTIVTIAEGDLWLPIIRSSKMQLDLKYALEQLGHISATQIRSIALLWSPLDNETLSKEELVHFYPHLKLEQAH